MYSEKRFVHLPTSQLPQCHAATILERHDGSLYCAWYAGAYEKAKDVCIFSSLFQGDTAGRGPHWENEELLADTPGFSEGNPILFAHPNGELWHFYVTMMGSRWDTCLMKWSRSRDAGADWDAPKILREEQGWMTGCKPILGPEGEILLPVYLERGVSYVMRTDDRGEHWQLSEPVTAAEGLLQPSLAYLSDGRLLMLMRTYEPRGGTLWQSFSDDHGKRWTSPVRSPLPNPNARVDVVRLASGRLALGFNDTPEGRTPLTLALSEDDGKSWPYRLNVETEPGEYSYPALIQATNGHLHLVYTYRRTHIAHFACDEEAILAHPHPH